MLARLPLWAWFLAGAGVVATAQFARVARDGGHVTALLQVGEASPARALIALDFPALWPGPAMGHDGKYNYLIARAPAFWRAAPATLDALQDPAYRYRRPLYPLLAGLGGVLSPAGTLAGLVVVQWVAGGAAAATLAALGRRLGLPAGFALVNLFNPGLVSAACLLTCDLLAHALAVAGWLCAEARRGRAAAVLFALALLTKEYYALTPLALAAALAWERRWRAAAVVGGLPLLPVLAWSAAVTAGLGVGAGGGNFTWPGGGVVAAAPGWDAGVEWVGAGGVALVAVTLAAAASPRLPARLRLACAAWGLLGLCASVHVWRDPHDLLRAVAPAWWLAAWAVFARFGAGAPLTPSAGTPSRPPA